MPDQEAGEYIQTEYDIARCSYKLLESALFAAHKDYIRRQIVYSLLQVRRASTDEPVSWPNLFVADRSRVGRLRRYTALHHRFPPLRWAAERDYARDDERGGRVP